MAKNHHLPKVISPPEKYMQEVLQYPLLTKEEEMGLAVKWFKDKDLEAAHKLVISNLRFVIKIANEYAGYGLKLMDIIQEGNIGLMRAVKTYNPYKDTRLITYAVWWIRSYIHDYIQKNWSVVKIGTTQAQRKLFYRLQKEKEALDQLDIEGTPKLLAQKLGVREKDVIEMDQRMMHGRDVSLDAPINKDDEDKHTRIDFIVDQQGNVEQALSEHEEEINLKNTMNEFQKTLKDRDLFIFKKRLIAEKPMTLQAIADKYKISKERARQLEEKIKKNLKTFLSSLSK
ncbi:MAG: hypothetical protein A2Z91_01575 [Deltaproteobacteria bacterium GWA2_38_16]|nr:MAG: hypothetical protein A2Z91_01575 [Deltaproteobacteria bacterium GWA2_38_16]OGQ03301.1 MAG: hypothetical protein A3D19_00110 [Deltaproteobacteria bacterium RIFCSPHIGHO2_02_FULL_38_15]OGQ34622.1 MAG: hypothetical protein A3A72_08840 [Deltaproteobacteria bacterium RIFCSPLOWO2_01_FULL_38_9]HBQ22031.1 RNA polymerase subunit sigma-70 [Deltaproteobacteria bacterium]